MAHSKEVRVQRVPCQCGDGHLSGLIVAKSPERQQRATPLFVIIACILVVFEVCEIWGEGGREGGRENRCMGIYIVLYTVYTHVHVHVCVHVHVIDPEAQCTWVGNVNT